MYREKLEDLSVYYYIEDMFTDVTGINIVDDFPTTNLVTPTISVTTDTIDTEIFELGNRERSQFRTWYIDVFAKNKAQRDEFSYRILNELEECIPVYNYDDGFPPTVVAQLGCLQPEDIRLRIIRVFPELVDKLYWRATVTLVATYSQV